MNFFKKSLLPLFLFIAFFAGLNFTRAANPGTIPSSTDCSGNQSCAEVDQDDSKINFGCANCDVQVSDSALSGYAWGENIGWINLNCVANGGVNCALSGNFKVANTTSGILSGYAWGENAGWINFGPFLNSPTSPVVINTSTGNFSGFAWSQNYGWLNFSCPGVACVNTTWRPVIGDGGGDDTPQINGLCGSSNGGTFSSIPISNLCDAGIATAVSGTGLAGDLWRWDCKGINNGFDNYNNGGNSCSANLSVVAPPTGCTLGDTQACTSAANICGDINSGTQTCDSNGNFGSCSAVQPSDDMCTLPPPVDGDACVPPSVLDPATGQCTVTPPPPEFCDLPENANAPECNPIGPPVLDCSLPENANLPECLLLPPDEGCTGPDCDVVPTCTGPDCVITPGGGCVGSDCSVTPGDGGGDPGDGGPGPGGVLGDILSSDVIGQITDIANDPTVSAVTQVFTTTALVLGAAVSVASALFASPLAASELVMIPFRLWTLLLAFLGIRRQAKRWGLVYDSVTMQPLDPAYVVLKDAQGNEIGTSLTDIDGRYGFPVESGTYKLYANKTDYQFPSTKLLGKDHDTLHKDLYFGEDIIVRSSGEIITKNIPMDRLNFNWNEWAKNQKGLMKFYNKRNKLIAEISSFLFGVGFTVATVALIFAPKGYNIAIFGLYVVLFILRHTSILKAKKTGSIADSQGNPLSFAIVRVYPAAIPDVEITHRVADKFGRFYALVPNGNYIVKIDEKTGEDAYSTVFTSPPLGVSKGLIDSDFKINR